MKKALQEIVKERRLVCDGAMGTQLMLAGLEQGGCGELWNLIEPARVLASQRRYVEAGVDASIIETQTASEELGVAFESAKAAGARCIIGSLAYDLSEDGTFFKTMMGVSPEKAAKFVEKKGGHVVALNCGTGMDMP